MIKKFKISHDHVVDPLELELNKPNKLGIYVRNVTGLGYPDSDIPITELALSDVNYYNHSVFQTRNIVFTLSFVAGVNVELKRNYIYLFFPSKIEIKIEIETSERESSIYIKGYVETLEADIFNKDETIQISLLCVNPYFVGGERFNVRDYGTPFSFNSNQFVNNGLWYYIYPGTGGLDSFKIIYENGFIAYGNSERFRDPFDVLTILDIVPDGTEIDSVVKENRILPKQKILFDTTIDGFGIFLTDSDDNMLKDITGDCKVYGDYPSVVYGKNNYQIIAYSVKENPESNVRYIKKEATQFNQTGFWDDLWVEPESHPSFFPSGTECRVLQLEPFTENSGILQVDDGYFSLPTVMVLSFYDETSGTKDEKTPIERLIGNIIVFGARPASLDENTLYINQFFIGARETKLDDGNDVQICQDVGKQSVINEIKSNVTEKAQFMPNPFYDCKNFIINNEKDFKDLVYKFVRFSQYATPHGTVGGKNVVIEQKYYYRSVLDVEKKYVFKYENSTPELISDIMYDEYIPAL